MGMTLPSPIAGVRKEAKTVVAAKSRMKTMPSNFLGQSLFLWDRGKLSREEMTV